MLCHRGHSGWLHMHYDIYKVAACRLKLFQLIDREAVKNESEQEAEQRQVMLKDGLQDVDKLQDNLKDKENDTVGAKYLKMVNSVSFSDLSVYTVELLVSEHGRPEVKEAKNTEINNIHIILSLKK